jgi:hypothetical protein
MVVNIRTYKPNGSMTLSEIPSDLWPEDCVYIGRAGHGQDGYFGNPVQVGKKCPVCGLTHRKGGDTLPCYEKYLNKRIEEDEDFRKKLISIGDKTLVCFCSPNPCHGDSIIKAINELRSHR